MSEIDYLKKKVRILARVKLLLRACTILELPRDLDTAISLKVVARLIEIDIQDTSVDRIEQELDFLLAEMERGS